MAIHVSDALCPGQRTRDDMIVNGVSDYKVVQSPGGNLIITRLRGVDKSYRRLLVPG